MRPDARLPNLIGIGAPKAGTTWLFESLRDHPDVFMAPVKETNFLNYESIEGREEEYLAHFAAADSERVVGEISTRYLTSHSAPARVRDLLPDAKLLLSLRDPVEQVQSHYWHLRRQNFHQWEKVEPPQTLEEALDRYPDRLLDPARYARHVQRWLEAVPLDRWHVTSLERIRDDAAAVVTDLYSFLEIDPAFRPDALEAHDGGVRRGVSPRSPSAERAHLALRHGLNRYAYRPLMAILGTTRAAALKDGLKVRERMERAFMSDGYPEVSPQTAHRVRQLLGTDVEHLSDLLDQDFSAWGVSPPASDEAMTA